MSLVETEIFPDDFKQGNVTPVFKAEYECGNYITMYLYDVA